MTAIPPQTFDQRPLRVAHISASYGGVAVAAMRLHLALLQQGVQSHFFASNAETRDTGLPHSSALTAPNRPLRYADTLTKVIASRTGLKGMLHISSLHRSFDGYDVIHLHGADTNWFNLNALPRLSKRHALVWTMHDQHLGTGACGYTELWDNCQRWRTGCGNCPIAHTEGWLFDSTHRIYKRKQHLLPASDLAIVALNQWMLDFLRANPMTQRQTLRLIPNSVDTSLFTPHPQAESRAALQLPAEGRLILFVAANLSMPRKGARYYVPLLRALKERAGDKPIGAVFVGAQLPETWLELREIMPVHALGRINDVGRLAQAYSACDFFVVPSTIDNLPSTVIESMACGTPVAVFRVGGIPDMITPGQTGVLADLGDVEGMAEAISAALDEPGRLEQMRQACRETVLARYSFEVQAASHITFYHELLAQRGSNGHKRHEGGLGV